MRFLRLYRRTSLFVFWLIVFAVFALSTIKKPVEDRVAGNYVSSSFSPNSIGRAPWIRFEKLECSKTIGVSGRYVCLPNKGVRYILDIYPDGTYQAREEYEAEPFYSPVIGGPWKFEGRSIKFFDFTGVSWLKGEVKANVFRSEAGDYFIKEKELTSEIKKELKTKEELLE